MAERARTTSTSLRLSKFQQKRRDAALERQKSARKAAVDRARQLVENTSDSGSTQQGELHHEGGSSNSSMMDTENNLPGSEPQGTSSSREKQHEFWSRQLMHPEWLVDIPLNLREEWYLTPRPEGKRCTVVAARGGTTSRTRNGQVLHRFQSALPGGSRKTAGGPGSGCILDCVFHEANLTYYVLDAMGWGGHDLYDCTAEFRLFWVSSKMQEDGATGVLEGVGETFPFNALHSCACTPEGLWAAKSQAMPFILDGFLLRHKDGHYTPGQVPSPLSLIWKDAETSRYFIDTDAAGFVQPHQMVVLALQMDRTVATSDDPPIVLGKLPEEFVSKMGKKLKLGMPLRFSIGDGGMEFLDGRAVGADLRFEGTSNPRRGRVDSASKIIFQYHARRNPLTFDQLVEASAAVSSVC